MNIGCPMQVKHLHESLERLFFSGFLLTIIVMNDELEDKDIGRKKRKKSRGGELFYLSISSLELIDEVKQVEVLNCHIYLCFSHPLAWG